MGQSTQTMHMLTKPQVFYNESHKTTLGYQNPLYLTQAQRKVLALYCGRTIVKTHDALSVMDTEETLILAEEIRLKMHAKQNDPIAKDKKVNISPIDYVALNKLSKHFVPQKQLSAEQAFWLPISKPVSETPPVQPDAVLKEIPHELPIISLGKEITDMKEVFNQIKIEAAKCSIERKYFETEKKELLIENDRLLKNIICQDVMCLAMHSDVETNSVLPANDNRLEYAKLEKSYIYEYSKMLELEAELSKRMIWLKRLL
ncbi:hypothetical protein Tco_1581672 [Tanacetum coccineum]